LSKINGKIVKKPMFSREVIYTLVITNLISFLIGTGIGVWLSKRGVNQCDEIISIAI
jgi:BCL2/adenovirus E1B protein-interacting protein 3